VPLASTPMCGRFVSSSSPDQLADYFGATPSERTLEANFNVAPTDDVYAVRARDGHRRLGTLRWGLVPPWAKDPSTGSRMINARAETVATKPAFRRPFERRRCLLPADGFYEWAKVPDRRTKQPYYVRRADGEPVAFAGFWERWTGPGDDEAPLFTCCLITTAPNAEMARIHDRMPVLVPPGAWDRWLDPAVTDPDELVPLLAPAPDGLLELRPVSTEVNNVRNQGPHLIDARDAGTP
jgi:putative SOS response-associated peptidase YedK